MVLFLDYLEKYKNLNPEKILIKEIKAELVIDFLEYLQMVRKVNNSTRNLRLAGIKSFFRFLMYQNIESLYETQRILSIHTKKTKNDLVKYISKDAMKLIMEQPNLNTKRGVRQLAIISLMYDSAARVSELINLTPSMLRIENPSTIRITGKGNKVRLVPLMDAQLIHLKNYIKIFNLDNPVNQLQPLFFNSRREKLTRAGVTYILRAMVNKARVKNPEVFPDKISCHTLRHTKAMHMLQAGLELIYIRDILGHSSIETTQIYAKADTLQKRIALENTYENLSPEEPLWEGNKGLINWLKTF
ncbi:site-specific integrase [Maribacter spongiicola]|uniref:site-specific integrase n=1 Tax=Maribacter spongiicola TaxID=1206753 RepID=UPI001FBBC881|nr:site-specific integrase [Maribacter spongiicola]